MAENSSGNHLKIRIEEAVMSILKSSKTFRGGVHPADYKELSEDLASDVLLKPVGSGEPSPGKTVDKNEKAKTV